MGESVAGFDTAPGEKPTRAICQVIAEGVSGIKAMTVALMSGRFMIPLSAEHRSGAGVHPILGIFNSLVLC
ncbi:hypothetical protein GCM10010912_52840 [Paenibacillus albidus]|uniref:Uncharacterized protein n=1 Tax=Paenibacillus albidus TaxID=2041023 RepID=A0A917FTZ3_9BACL|nr:hypothetical protein GCM10010912_52840 [Paenibacillus albidus]